MRINTMDFFGLTKDFKQVGFLETSYHKRLFREVKTALGTGGLVAMSGVVGSGKTVILRELQRQLSDEGKILVSRSLMVDKDKVSLASLIAALFYDLTQKKDIKIPGQGERRERELQDLVRQRRRTVALFVDEAHDLHHKTLRGLKRLLEVVQDGGGVLSVLLAGHPKLENDLKRPTMEEIGYRTSIFSIEASEMSRKEYIEWLLEECSGAETKAHDIVSPEAIEILAESLITPLQIIQHLTIALEASHEADEKPVSATMARSVLSGALNDWEANLARHGYDTKGLARLLDTQPAEVRLLFKGQLEATRTRELQQQLLVVGLPVQ